jgi:hypothetical protein
MRSIGVFRSSGTTPQLASDTIAHTTVVSIQRNVARENGIQNQKPKVGSLDSSQRTYLRSSAATISQQSLITPHTSKNVNVVNSALRRVRSAGTVPPLKKNAK